MTHIVYTDDGLLHNGQDSEDVARMIADCAKTDYRLVLYFHGGLVWQSKGEEIARKLDAPLRTAQVTPVFNVWNSGPIKTLVDSLPELAKEAGFRLLVNRIERAVRRKADAGSGEKGMHGLSQVAIQRIDAEVEARFTATSKQGFEETPLDATQLTELTPAEETTLRLELEKDPELGAALTSLQAAAAKARLPMDGMKAAPMRGVSILSVVRVIGRVIHRFIRGTDHGIHATIVEELLREVYLDDAAEIYWREMREYTSKAFSAGSTHGGTAILDALATHERDGVSLKVTLIGHSAGAIFITNLIRAWAQRGGKLQFDVIFLAPAVSFREWHEKMSKDDIAARYIRKLRIFGLKDPVERDDALFGDFPFPYPSSLLYLVSGLCHGEADEPLLGMQRYHERRKPYADSNEALKWTRDYLEGCQPAPLIWSVSQPAPAGRQTAAKQHGDFDQEKLTVDSIVSILRDGYK